MAGVYDIAKKYAQLHIRSRLVSYSRINRVSFKPSSQDNKDLHIPIQAKSRAVSSIYFI